MVLHLRTKFGVSGFSSMAWEFIWMIQSVSLSVSESVTMGYILCEHAFLRWGDAARLPWELRSQLQVFCGASPPLSSPGSPGYSSQVYGPQRDDTIT